MILDDNTEFEEYLASLLQKEGACGFDDHEEQPLPIQENIEYPPGAAFIR